MTVIPLVGSGVTGPDKLLNGGSGDGGHIAYSLCRIQLTYALIYDFLIHAIGNCTWQMYAYFVNNGPLSVMRHIKMERLDLKPLFFEYICIINRNHYGDHSGKG